MHLTSDNSHPPTPLHDWSANSDWDITAFSMKDRCLSCKVARYNPMSGARAVTSNSVAAGPCPERDWRGLIADELRPYVIAYTMNDGHKLTPSEKLALQAVQP
jgi:hypothetical protein